MQQAPINIPGIPGAEEPPIERRWVDWLEFLIAIAIAGFFSLALLGFVLDITSKQHVKSGLSRPGQIVVAAICAGIVYLAGRWAHHAEHRLRHRRGHPAAVALETAVGLEAPASATAPAEQKPPPHFSSPLRRRRRYSPTASIIVVVVFGLFTLGFFIGAFAVKADGARSAYTQKHGIAASAIVTNVNNIEDCGRSSCSYHAKIAVRLLRPISGATTTTVSYPDETDLRNGDQVQILVDPKQLSYAEFPGSRSVQSWQWIAFLAIAALFAVFWVLSVRELRKQLRLRREHAQAAVAIAPA